ncbi:MAG: hypothetical protein AAF495_19890 [Pseudomonadota bacterium]
MVEETLAEKLKDRSLVELDVEREVRGRLLGSVKTFSYLLGIPLAILGLALATVGITSYSEFKKTLEATSSELEEKGQTALAALERDAADINAKAEQLREEFTEQELALAEFRERAPALEQAAEEVADLQRRVEAIEIFGRKARPLTGSEKQKAEQAMAAYRSHLDALGLRVAGNPPVYRIEKDDDQPAYTFYDPVGRRIALGSDWDVYSLLVMYGYFALFPAGGQNGTSANNVVLEAVSEYLAWSYLSEFDPESLSRWRGARATSRNLAELLQNATPYGWELYEARSLFREALLDVEQRVGAPELGRVVVITWHRTVSSLPGQKPDAAVRAFATQLQANENIAAEITQAFAKVGLDLSAAEGTPAD